MKKSAKLPTILGLIILIAGVVAGVFLINSQQVFKIGANVDAIPKNVRVSNITDTSATVTWTTDIESTGFVKWGKSESSLSKVALEEGDEKSIVHSVNILGIEPKTKIYFKINSNSTDHDNQGAAWTIETKQSNQAAKDTLIASGTVLKSNGSTPARAIVYLTINGTLVSALSSVEGNYVLPLSNYFANIPETTAIEISVQGGTGGTSQAVIYPKSVKFIPAMILGKTYDFRTAVQNDSNQLPESSLSLPESVELSSRFVITTDSNKDNEQEKTTPTIESIDEGEIITTTDPEFFGSGPTNEQIEIQVESELQSAVIQTNSKGAWSWSPPNNLEPGEHKVTLKWKDANGILRTLTRTFIVSAAEGPAFESTPSATPTNQAAATATATSKATATSVSTSSATPIASKTPTATLMPTPETGSLTPTIGLFIMGIGILLSSIFVYKKPYA